MASQTADFQNNPQAPVLNNPQPVQQESPACPYPDPYGNVLEPQNAQQSSAFQPQYQQYQAAGPGGPQPSQYPGAAPPQYQQFNPQYPQYQQYGAVDAFPTTDEPRKGCSGCCIAAIVIPIILGVLIVISLVIVFACATSKVEETCSYDYGGNMSCHMVAPVSPPTPQQNYAVMPGFLGDDYSSPGSDMSMGKNHFYMHH